MTATDTILGEDSRARCRWIGTDAEYQRYHDEEWGQPLHGDVPLFEKLVLEGFQAGLSWITILKRRPAFREAFHGFDPERIANLGDDDIESLMSNTGIIRNRAKIEATISNARVTLELTRESPGALDELLWSFAPAPRASAPGHFGEVPAVTPESVAMSAALRRIGYRFVGPTTMYALMQSVGMVDDHVRGCWRAVA
jgi:DNA-3-methyladenine glycosylase I